MLSDIMENLRCFVGYVVSNKFQTVNKLLVKKYDERNTTTHKEFHSECFQCPSLKHR